MMQEIYLLFLNKQMNRIFVLFIVCLILFLNDSYPDNLSLPPDSSNKYTDPSSFEIFKYDINKSLHDGLDIIKAPTGFSGSDWLAAGVVMGTTSLSILLDKDVRETVRNNQTASMDNITKIGYYYGEVVPAVSLSTGLYAGGLIFNERSVSLTGRLLGESLIYAGTINLLLKILFSRSRPYKEKGNMDFWNYKFNNDFYSLPSGHSTVAFTISTVLAERIDNIYATIGLYSLAAFTAYQRIYSDNHWFSDTVVGAALGIIISRAVINLNKDDTFYSVDSNDSGISLKLDRGYGFTFRFVF